MLKNTHSYKRFSEREYNFLAFYESNNIQDKLDIIKLNLEDKSILLSKIFNWPIGRSWHMNETRNGDYHEKKQLCLNRLIPDKDLRWLDQSPLSHLLYLLTENIFINNHAILLSEPLDKEICINLIKAHIDCNGIDRNDCHKLNKQLYQRSLHLTKTTTPIAKFIEKNRSKEQKVEKWLHEYQLKNFNLSYELGEFNRNPIISPEHKIIYNALRTNNIELFIIKASNAWSQKKHRDSLNGKRIQSYSLSENSIIKLEEISKSQRRKKNETLEILIEDAWLAMAETKKPIRR